MTTEQLWAVHTYAARFCAALVMTFLVFLLAQRSNTQRSVCVNATIELHPVTTLYLLRSNASRSAAQGLCCCMNGTSLLLLLLLRSLWLLLLQPNSVYNINTQTAIIANENEIETIHKLTSEHLERLGNRDTKISTQFPSKKPIGLPKTL